MEEFSSKNKKCQVVLGYFHRLVLFLKPTVKMFEGETRYFESILQTVKVISNIPKQQNRGDKFFDSEIEIIDQTNQLADQLLLQSVQILSTLGKFYQPERVSQIFIEILNETNNPQIQIDIFSQIINFGSVQNILLSFQPLKKICVNSFFISRIGHFPLPYFYFYSSHLFFLFFIFQNSLKTELRKKILLSLKEFSVIMEKRKESFLREEMNELFKTAITIFKNIFVEFYKKNQLNWETRLIFSLSLKDLIRYHLQFIEENNSEDFFINFFILLLKDKNYLVRLFMAESITILFKIYEVDTSIFNEIYKSLLPLVLGIHTFFFFFHLFLFHPFFFLEKGTQEKSMKEKSLS